MTIQRTLKRTIDRAVEGALDEMNTVGREWSGYNTRVVSNWSGKPQFTYRVIASRRQVWDLEIEARGDHAMKWVWTDKGTEPHKIPLTPRPYNLRFRTEYSARTRPVARYGVGNGRSSGDWVSVPEVNHPGTTARKFTETYANDNKQDIIERITARIRRELAR